MQDIKYIYGISFHRLFIETSHIFIRNAQKYPYISTTQEETIFPKTLSSLSKTKFFSKSRSDLFMYILDLIIIRKQKYLKQIRLILK